MLAEALGGIELTILGDLSTPLVMQVLEIFCTLLLVGRVGNAVAIQFVPLVVC